MTSELKQKGIWITWERQTRNQSASSYIDVPLFEIIYPESRPVLRYLRSSLKTIRLLTRHNPKYVFSQNPSIVLSILTVVLKRIASYKVIIDAHNSGIYGAENKTGLIKTINKFIIRSADAVIVTNSHLANYVHSVGGTPIVLPDPLPQLSINRNPAPPATTLQRKLKALCITSWSMDEPFLNILDAASNFEQEIDFYFSGNFHKVKTEIPDCLPDNIKLLGFIDEKDFFYHLFTSDFCIDLTNRSDCMVCGAYESIAAEKPIILSNTDVQKRYFSKGAVFCENTSTGISDAIKTMVVNVKSLKNEAEELKHEILEREDNNRKIILDQIHRL